MRKLKNEELGRISIDEYKNSKKLNVCLVLDDVRSLNNVGSAFRTSDAFRVQKIWLCGITGRPPHREIQKTALGATESVEWEYVETANTLISDLRKQGWTICSVEQAENSVRLDQLRINPNHRFALIFGNEVFGVHQDLVSQSDQVIEIPQFGTKHSLNISVSIGVVLWEFCRQINPD